MEDILKEIAESARLRVEEDKKAVSLGELRKECEKAGPGGGEDFLNALARDGMSFICEIKKASPSKGIISEDFPYLEIAKEYQDAGADCISCLTEPGWFLGSDEIFREIRAAVTVPMLRKDFVVDDYQIYQARMMGADAILLICALMDWEALVRRLQICDGLGLAALVEAHDRKEIETAVSAGAGIIGVNNRNLKDFSVDTGNSARLRELVPPGVLFVAESGIQNPDQVRALEGEHVDAVLVGETLMRSDDKKETLKWLRGEA